jgi:hypothetical protein
MLKILPIVAISLVACGGRDSKSGSPTPQMADITGQYSILATSTKKTVLGVTGIYTNLSQQSNGVFGGDPNTFVCPSNSFSCNIGAQLSAEVSEKNVSITLLTLGLTGHDTISLTGTVSGTTISGTYTDTEGDWKLDRKTSRVIDWSFFRFRRGEFYEHDNPRVHHCTDATTTILTDRQRDGHELSLFH